VPARLDPALSEQRELGVRVAYGFEPS